MPGFCGTYTPSAIFLIIKVVCFYLTPWSWSVRFKSREAKIVYISQQTDNETIMVEQSIVSQELVNAISKNDLISHKHIQASRIKDFLSL